MDVERTEALASSPWQSPLSFILLKSQVSPSSFSFPSMSHQGGFIVDHVIVGVAMLAPWWNKQQDDQYEEDNPTQAHESVGGNPQHWFMESYARNAVACNICGCKRAFNLRHWRTINL